MKNKKGFTLLELIVIISIMAIMGSILAASLTSLRVNARLKTAQTEVASAIKLAQNYSLQGRIETETTLPVCGYGFRFINNQDYEIFYNELDTGSFSDCDQQNNDLLHDYIHYNALVSDTVSQEDRSLPVGVTLGEPAASQTEMFFTIPHANTFNSTGSSFAGGTWRFDSSGSNKTLVINSRGLIDEN